MNLSGKMGLNEDAQGYYDHFLPILKGSGRFKDGDEKGLGRLCHLWSIADKLEQEMNQAWGVQLPKNILPIYDKVSKSILLLESAFHMNPNARKEKSKGVEKKKKAFDGGMTVSKTA